MASVAASLRAAGTEPVVFDLEYLRHSGFTLDERRLTLAGEMALADHELAASGRGWLRRLAPPGWSIGPGPESHDGVLRASWYALLFGWLHTVPLDWLTAPAALALAENKAVALRVAHRIGVAVPRSISTSSLTAVRALFGDHVLIKPLGPARFVDADGYERAVSPTVVRTDELTEDEVAAGPFLFQEYIPARRHLRVVTVGDQAWVAVLEAAGRPLDWRRDDSAFDAFHPGGDAVCAQAARGALRVARSLGVGFSSQDWLDTGGRLVFLDLNPAGQWLFLPAAVAEAATAALAAWLTRPSGR